MSQSNIGSNWMIDNGPSATSTAIVGNTNQSPQPTRGVLSLWNGSSYTHLYYPANSTTAVTVTSTSPTVG